MTVRKCFVCTGNVRGRNANPTNFDLLLCQILELPHLGNEDVKKFNEVSYCPCCMDRISVIGIMLDELEKLEKRILDEKYMIEVQINENAENYNDDSKTSSVEFRAQIVTELKTISIQSMLNKIQNKQVGHRRRPLRIMRNVRIPRDLKAKATNQILEPDTAQSDNVVLTIIPQDDDLEHQPDSVNNLIGDPLNFNTIEAPMNECEMDINIKFEEAEIHATDQQIMSEVTALDSFAQHNYLKNCDQASEGDVGSVIYKNNQEFHVQKNPQIHQKVEGSSSSQAFICGICEASFDDYNQLEIHDRLHFTTATTANSSTSVWSRSNQIKKKRRNPNICHWDFKSLSPSRQPKKCEECGKMLSSPHTWKQHVLSFHRGQHQFKCSLCTYGCQKRAHLSAHMLVHSEERHFKCPVCLISFKQKGSLRRHSKSHNK